MEELTNDGLGLDKLVVGYRKKKPQREPSDLRAAFIELMNGPPGYERRALGNTLAGKKFEDYEIVNDGQRKLVDGLLKYANELDEKYLSGGNIMISGQRGTGKDHLLSALAKRVFNAGYKVVWISGPLMNEVARRAIDEKEFGEETYRSLIYADFLWISDPNLASAVLTNYQAEWLYRIIDHRARFTAPTWVTANFNNLEAMEAQIGGPTADRIINNAKVFYCDWASYRGVV